MLESMLASETNLQSTLTAGVVRVGVAVLSVVALLRRMEGHPLRPLLTCNCVRYAIC
jgi:hypothetical protein